MLVAQVLKNYDSIVKEYSAQVGNVLTSLACAFFFPDKFQGRDSPKLTVVPLLTYVNSALFR
jgi:hypothetical protein